MLGLVVCLSINRYTLSNGPDPRVPPTKESRVPLALDPCSAWPVILPETAGPPKLDRELLALIGFPAGRG